jgi:hypothetical protein
MPGGRSAVQRRKVATFPSLSIAKAVVPVSKLSEYIANGLKL